MTQTTDKLWVTKTLWQIYPEHTNPKPLRGEKMVHGGSFWTACDRAAAIVAQMFCDDQKPDLHALTTGCDKCQFHDAAKCGDVIEITASVKRIGSSRVDVWVEAIRMEDRKKMFDGQYNFCSFKYDPNTQDYVLAKHS